MLDEKPILYYPLNGYFEAYNHLNACRETGYGVEQPLTVCEISEYADRFNFTSDFRFFFRAMKSMDNVERRHRKTTRDREEAKGKASKGSAKRPPKKR